MKLQVYLQLDSKFVSWCGVSSKNEILLNWTDSLPQHHAVAPSMPLPSQTHTHIKLSTHRNPQTFWQPSSILPVCSGRVRGSGMTTWQLWYLPRGPSVQSGMKQRLFPRRKWPVSERGALLSNQRTAEACRCYLLGPRCSFSLTDNRGGKKVWPGSSSSASEHGGWVSEGEKDTNRNKEVMNEKNQSNLSNLI